MTIASYLNLSYPAYNDHSSQGKWGETAANAYAYFIYLMISLGFPCAMLYVALVPKEWLLKPEFKQKWGFLYNPIKTDTFGQRAYFCMFIFRRAVLVYTSLWMYQYPSI